MYSSFNSTHKQVYTLQHTGQQSRTGMERVGAYVKLEVLFGEMFSSYPYQYTDEAEDFRGFPLSKIFSFQIPPDS
jgi:hypothetical protein